MLIYSYGWQKFSLWGNGANESKIGLLIVRHEGRYFGPFIESNAGFHTAKLMPGSFEVLPLTVPRGEHETRGPFALHFETDLQHRYRVDRVKIDTRVALAGALQTFALIRDEERVLTADEMLQLWEILFDVSQCFKSLMHHAEAAIDDPSEENMIALRRAVWRNRASDDVDPHYADRFW